MRSIYLFNLNITQSNLDNPCDPRGSRPEAVRITRSSRYE
jgi:hypothetical protein